MHRSLLLELGVHKDWLGTMNLFEGGCVILCQVEVVNKRDRFSILVSSEETLGNRLLSTYHAHLNTPGHIAVTVTKLAV
jgi:hypothetical protein